MNVMYEIGMLFASLWMADFLSGFFHWLEDTYCTKGMPIVGKLICDPNIEHHRDPGLLVRAGTFVSRNVFQWVACAVIFVALLLFGWASRFWFMALLFLSFANEVHRWNHVSRPGRWIQLIKDVGIIQSHRQHALHHKPPFDRNYCVLTSQINPILEAIGFWRGLEWFVFRLTFIKPKRGEQ